MCVCMCVHAQSQEAECSTTSRCLACQPPPHSATFDNTPPLHRRAYERHFREFRHENGVRALGIRECAGKCMTVVVLGMLLPAGLLLLVCWQLVASVRHQALSMFLFFVSPPAANSKAFYEGE